MGGALASNDDAVEGENKYVNHLLQCSGLKLLQERRAKKSWWANEGVGLIFLVLMQAFWEAVRGWTNKKMKVQGHDKLRKEKFAAYTGLEMGMSIIRLNDIKQYWADSAFMGHETFKIMISRMDFQNICANIPLHDLNVYDHDLASSDPLWHSRSMLEHFTKKSAGIAVPVGASALDECMVWMKARLMAHTYLPNKPNKYGIRFYVVFGSKLLFLSSIADNRSGNTTGISGATNYCRVFQDLHMPYNNILGVLNSSINKDSLSALWVLQMGQQTKLLQDPSSSHTVFTNNFYTHHTLANSLK